MTPRPDPRITLIVSIALTFAILRFVLHLRPDTDAFVLGYNLHHLFTGVLLAALCGIPAVLSDRPVHPLLVAGFGIGLGLALDEWVYLIVTDGSNAAYLLPVSFWSGLVMIVAACAYAALFGRRN